MFAAESFMYHCNTDSPQRSRFTKDEDEKLRQLVSLQSPPNWNEISKKMTNRTPRQCRERYANYLRPNLINGPWTQEENDLLNDLYEKYGPKWSLISQSFKSRSSVNIKNHHSSLASQKIAKDRPKPFRANSYRGFSPITSEPKKHESKINEKSSFSIPQVFIESKNNSSSSMKSSNSQEILELPPKSDQEEGYKQLYNIFLNYKNEDDELWSTNFMTFDESMISF